MLELLYPYESKFQLPAISHRRANAASTICPVARFQLNFIVDLWVRRTMWRHVCAFSTPRSLLIFSNKKPKPPPLENTQNRVQPPKTSPIEQISDRLGPKFSTLQRVTLQSLKSCYRWSILLRESVSNLAPASAQNQPKIWKYAWEVLIFFLYFLTF